VVSLEGLGGQRCPRCASSEIGQHVIQFVGVDLSVHPTGAVWGHLPPQHLQVGNQCVVAVEPLSEVVGRLVILNPEGDVPGLPVCPSVEGGHGSVRLVDGFSMAPLGGVWGSWWTVPQLSQDLQVVQDLAIAADLSVDELVCLDGEQALRLCPGISRHGLPGVRGDEDGEAALVEVVHAVILQGQDGVCVTPCASASGGLVVGVADFFLYTVEDLLIHPIGAVLMEADQIIENCHLVSGKGGQHVVAVEHCAFVVDAVSLQGHGLVALQECAVHPLSQRSARVDHQA